MKRSILAIILAICLLIGLTPSARAESSNDLIRDLLAYYSHHQENAQTDIHRLLDEIRTIDPTKADQWQQIMDAWSWACSDLEITPSVLPDGLPQDDSLCIIVMGFALDYHGSMKPELLGRMEVLLASAEKYPNAYLLCTGGGTAQGNPYVTEAGRMAAWLENRGVDPARIIVENRSYSTELNAKYSMEILHRDYPQVDTLALVSSDYHLRRCWLLFQAVLALSGLEDVYRIAGCAGFETGYIGESGYFSEAESLGNLVGLNARYTAEPPLSQLTGISVSGATECQPGEELALTITASYNTGYSRDITSMAEFTGTAPDSPGQQDMIITYTENGITAEAVIMLTILPPPTEVTEAPATVPTEEPTVPPTESPAKPEAPEGNWILPAATVGAVLTAIISVMVFSKREKGKFEK